MTIELPSHVNWSLQARYPRPSRLTVMSRTPLEGGDPDIGICSVPCQGLFSVFHFKMPKGPLPSRALRDPPSPQGKETWFPVASPLEKLDRKRLLARLMRSLGGGTPSREERISYTPILVVTNTHLLVSVRSISRHIHDTVTWTHILNDKTGNT
jgi:hypothetical protein